MAADTLTVRRNTLYRPADPDLLPRREAGLFIGVSVSTLAHWAGKGVGPRFLKLGRSSYYRRAELLAWMDTCVSRQVGD